MKTSLNINNLIGFGENLGESATGILNKGAKELKDKLKLPVKF
jgi:hypothetical protein